MQRHNLSHRALSSALVPSAHLYITAIAIVATLTMTLVMSGCRTGGLSAKTFGGANATNGASIAVAIGALGVSVNAISTQSGSSGLYSPTTLADFDCFAVNVVSSDIKQVPVCGGSSRMGAAVGFFRRGEAIELNVPFGENRTFQVWGFANTPNCGDVTSLVNTPFGEVPAGFGSPGYLLAEKAVNITSRKMNVEIDLSFAGGVNPIFCGSAPAPATTIDSAFLTPGVEATQISNGYTSSTNEVCVRYHTTAISPIFSCYVDDVLTTCAQGPCNDHPDGLTSQYGVHRVTIGGMVPAGTHTFKIVTTDNAYNTTDPNPPTFVWTVDTTPPVVTLSGFTPGALAGATYYTNRAAPVALVRADEASTLQIQADAGGYVTCGTATTANFDFSCPLGTTLATGAHLIDVRATNYAGLTSTSAGHSLVVDQILPTIDASTNWPMGGSFTTGVSAVAADTAPGTADPASIRCTVNGAVSSSCAPIAFSESRGGGKQTVVFNANDYAGNRAAPFTRSVYIDNASGLPVLGRTTASFGFMADESATDNLVAVGNLPGETGLDSPGQSALDAVNNRLFVVDTGNNRVLVFRWDPIKNSVANRRAIDVIGQPDFHGSAAGSVGPSYTKFNAPKGVAVNTSGTMLYVADTDNNRVLRFTMTAAAITKTGTAFGQDTLAGTTANIDGSWAPGAATTATALRGLSAPQGLLFYSYGGVTKLYVADSGNCRVAVYDSPDDLTNTGVAPALSTHLGAGGLPLAAGQNWNCTTVDGVHLGEPVALAVDYATGHVYVTDNDFHRVSVWTTAATDTDAMYSVVGIADTVGAATLTVSLSGDETTEDSNVDGYIATLASPLGAAVVTDGVSQRYVAASFSAGAQSKVKFFKIGGTVGTPTYTYHATWNTLGSGASTTAMAQPGQMHFSAAKSALLISELGNHRLSLFKIGDALGSDQAMHDEIGHTDVSGSIASFTARVKNNPNETKLHEPTYVVADSVNKRLYVSDTGNNRVLIYQLTASDRRPAMAAAFVSLGIPFSGVSPDTTLLDPYSVFPTTLSVSNAVLNSPKGLALDSAKNLWVVDANHNRVLRFPTGTSSFPTDSHGKTLPIAADVVLGQTSMLNSATTTLNSPTGLAYDSTTSGGRLFIANQGTDRVSVFHGIDSLGAGTADVSADATLTVANDCAGTPSPNCLTDPQGLAYTTGIAASGIDPGLYIADSGNHRVVYVSFGAAGTDYTQAITKCYGWQGASANAQCSPAALGPNANNGAGAAQTIGAWGSYSLHSPLAVEVSHTAKYLYVADGGNHRVAAFDLTTAGNQPGNAANPEIFHAMGASDLATYLYDDATPLPLATPAGMGQPGGIFRLEVSGGTTLLYVVDKEWHRVVVYEVP